MCGVGSLETSVLAEERDYCRTRNPSGEESGAVPDVDSKKTLIKEEI